MDSNSLSIDANNNLTVGFWLKQGWETYKNNSCFWQVGLLYFAYEFILATTHFYISPTIDFLFLVFMSFTFAPVFMIGVLYMSLQALRGQGKGLSDIGIVFKQFARNWIAGFLLYLGVSIGMILLLIPGIYLNVTYFFSMFIINDKDMSIIESFKYSERIVDGFRWPLLGLLLLQLIPFAIGMPFTLGFDWMGSVNSAMVVSGVIPSLIANLILMPVFVIAFASAYENIMQAHKERENSEGLSQPA